jgi:hypothetical protein
MKKFTLEEVKQEFVKRDCTLLSNIYVNVDDFLLYKCNKHPNKELQISLDHLKRGVVNCPDCGKNIKLTLEDAKKEFIKRDLLPLFQKYQNSKEKLLAQTQEGYKVITDINHLRNCQTPDKFNISNPYTIENIKLWLKNNNRNNEIKLISNEYKGSHELLQWQCLKEDCGEIFNSRWCRVISGDGCPYCRGLKVSLSNCLATKNPELAKEWHSTKNGNFTPYDVVAGSNKKVWWKCSTCYHEWNADVSSRNLGNNCPKCNFSKGEKKIEFLLAQNNLKYIVQYKFYDCKNKKRLPFDFYLPDFNICIEYDGSLHYKTWSKSNTSFVRLKQTQTNDQIKNNYCKLNNIKLYRIPYWEFNNIEKILEDIVFNNSLDFAV